MKESTLHVDPVKTPQPGASIGRAASEQVMIPCGIWEGNLVRVQVGQAVIGI